MRRTFRALPPRRPIIHTRAPAGVCAIALALVAGSVAPPSALAQTAGGVSPPPAASPYLFYRPELDYGSAAQFGPLSALLDRGFSTLVWSSAERHPFRIDWGSGWSSVADALAHPWEAAARQGGMKKFLYGELVPVDWDVWEWAFATNYMGHVLGGGLTYRTLAEWYGAHGVPLPRVAGAATSMAVILVNEVIEGRGDDRGSASTASDVYLFEPLGIALFSIDPIARFVAVQLHGQDWSPQAALTLPNLQLLNNSQVISYHIALPWIERLDVLSVTGQGTHTGLLYDLDEEWSLGGGLGFAAKTRRYDEGGREHLDAGASGGLYLSRRGSLLANLNVYQDMETRAALNLYPGLAGGRLRDIGLWALWNRGGDFSLGLSARRIPGLGIGYDFWERP